MDRSSGIALSKTGDATLVPQQTHIRYIVTTNTEFAVARMNGKHSLEFSINEDDENIRFDDLTDEDRLCITRLDYLFFHDTIETAFLVAPNVEDLEYLTAGTNDARTRSYKEVAK